MGHSRVRKPEGVSLNDAVYHPITIQPWSAVQMAQDKDASTYSLLGTGH